MVELEVHPIENEEQFNETIEKIATSADTKLTEKTINELKTSVVRYIRNEVMGRNKKLKKAEN